MRAVTLLQFAALGILVLALLGCDRRPYPLLYLSPPPGYDYGNMV